MDLQQELESICREVSGCRAAVLMDLDGLVVLRHTEPGCDLDEEVLLVEMTSAIRQAIQAVQSVNGGELSEFFVGFDRGALVIRLLKDDHFIAMLMDPAAAAGKGRYVLRRQSPSLIRDLF